MGNLKRFYTIQDLPLATASNAGVIKPGNCLSVASDGTLNVNVPQVFNDVISGYLQSNSFYKDVEKTIVIPGEQGKLYVNKPDDTLYLFNTAQAKFKGIVGNFVLSVGQGLQGAGTQNSPLSVNPDDLMFGEENKWGYSIGWIESNGLGGDACINFYKNDINLIGHGNNAGGVSDTEEHKLSLTQAGLVVSFKDEQDEVYSNSFVLSYDGNILINNHGMNKSYGLAQLDRYGKLPQYAYNLSQYKGNYWLYDNTVVNDAISIEAFHDNISRGKVVITNADDSIEELVTIELTSQQKRILSHCNGFTVQFSVESEIELSTTRKTLFQLLPFAKFDDGNTEGSFAFQLKDGGSYFGEDCLLETNMGSCDSIEFVAFDGVKKTITITASDREIKFYSDDHEELFSQTYGRAFYNNVSLEQVRLIPKYIKDVKIWNRVLSEKSILDTLSSNSDYEESGNPILELQVSQTDSNSELVTTKASISLNSFDVFTTYEHGQNLLFSVTSNDIIYNGNSTNRAGGLVTLGEDMEIQENSQSYTISKGNYKDCTSVAINPQKFQIKQNNLQRDATSTLKFYDYLNIHLEQQRDFEGIRISDYHFGGENFNLDNTFIVNKNFEQQSKNSVFNTGDTTFNTGDTNFNTGNVTFNTSDFVIVNLMEGGPTSEYEKTKFDFCDTINLSSKNTVRWDMPDYYEEDVDLAELQISNSQVNINLTHIDVIGEQGDQSPVYHYGKYEFKYDGLYLNGNAPNTANGLVVLDSNSQIPSSVITPFAQPIVKILSNYKDGNGKVIINDMTPGLIFAVINNENKQVYPDIEYVNGCAVLTASGVSDVKWVIYKMSNLIYNG